MRFSRQPVFNGTTLLWSDRKAAKKCKAVVTVVCSRDRPTADNSPMQLHFTKMQGAGNDFVVLDETRHLLGLTTSQYRHLADRHFGVGADQILCVRPAPGPEVDFEYVIHNADGQEVEHCGNGARCFFQFVREHGLTTKDVVRVRTLNRVLTLQRNSDGLVTVEMGVPEFSLPGVPFDASGLEPRRVYAGEKWPLDLTVQGHVVTVFVTVLSMGNPHAVLIVDDVATAPVAVQGPLIEQHARFPRRVNAGFMQILGRSHIRLRVYERGAGETLACGTGACAAVVSGIRLGLLDARVDVETRGGRLAVAWDGEGSPVHLSGPAVTVFSGDMDLPA
jgi:diaminopimelate epimerase